MPYPSGMSRGDTPPHMIPRIRDSRKTFPDRNDKYISNWADWRHDDGPLAKREHGMSLDVVRPSDTLKGCPKNYKDYDPSLTTSDIYRAQPCLAHPTKTPHHFKPWKVMEKPELPEVEKSRAETIYPPIHPLRERDVSLATHDISGAGPCLPGLKTPRIVDPGRPHYTLLSQETVEPSPPRHNGRDAMHLADIHKATPAPTFPVRRQYRDTMQVEDEFKQTQRNAHGLTYHLTTHDVNTLMSVDCPIKTSRVTNPLNPSYPHSLPENVTSTSLHCTWDEEKKQVNRGDHKKGAPSTARGDIGEVHGSVPRTLTRDNGEPFLSLFRDDLPSAAPQRHIGTLPYNIYGPPGSRPFSTSLDTVDIPGAQADTLPRGPRMPQRTRLQTPGSAEG